MRSTIPGPTFPTASSYGLASVVEAIGFNLEKAKSLLGTAERFGALRLKGFTAAEEE
jgi:hypothetical protein